MPLDALAVGLEVLIEGDTRKNAAEKALERCFTQLDRGAAQILAVELEQIERAKRHNLVPPLVG